MKEFLRLLLSLSLSGAALTALTACLNRLLRGRVPKSLLYYLWLFALLRFLCPVGTPWSLSHRLVTQPLLPQTQGAVVPAQPGQAMAAPAEELQVPDQPLTPAPAAPVETEDLPSQSALPAVQLETETAAVFLWAGGLLAVLGRRLISYLRLERTLKSGELPVSLWEQELLHTLTGGERHLPRLRRSSVLGTPILTGLFQPTIWLPDNMRDRTVLGYALRHELVHWRRRDLLYKWALVLAAGIHWFNPAAWYLLRAAERDCELSCDEGAARNLSSAERTAYGAMLLWAAARQSRPAGGMPVSLWSQKENLKERLQNIMKPTLQTKKAKSLFTAAVAVVAAASAVLGAYALQNRENTTAGEPPLPSAAELETSLNLTGLETLGMAAESAVEFGEASGLVIAQEETGAQTLLLTWNGGESWEVLAPPQPEHDAFGELYADPENWTTSTFRVLADLPEEDITLYGFYQAESTGPESWCLLRRGSHWDQFANVTFCPGPQNRLSEMALADYDGDGVLELAVSNCTGTGTGVNAFDLYLFEETEAGGFALSAALTEQDLDGQVAAAVSSQFDPERFTYTLQAAGEAWECDLSADRDWLEDSPVGGPVAASEFFQYSLAPLWVSIGLNPEGMPMCTLAQYSASLVYDGSSITLVPESGRLDSLLDWPLTPAA